MWRLFPLFLLTCAEHLYKFPLNLIDKTPCCHDRLTTVTCQRVQLHNAIKFANRCATDTDFAMVQCCATCFSRSRKDSATRYDLMVLKHLKNPTTSSCSDRRGFVWCSKLAQKESFWGSPEFAHIGCTTFPFAFRECRHSCGYCSAGMHISRINYDYKIATDPRLCDIKTYFARPEEYFKTTTLRTSNTTSTGISTTLATSPPRTLSSFSTPVSQPIRKYTTPTIIETDFDPLAHLSLEQRRIGDSDYYVVTDHNYDDVLEELLPEEQEPQLRRRTSYRRTSSKQKYRAVP